MAASGSRGTAQADFDNRHNGTSIATMRFAAGAGTATLVAASETVLEPSDVLNEVGLSTPDATLADVGFTLANTPVQ